VGESTEGEGEGIEVEGEREGNEVVGDSVHISIR